MIELYRPFKLHRASILYRLRYKGYKDHKHNK
nr:MAG TPA: hypothetical protein [Caudoviricetes sp.]